MDSDDWYLNNGLHLHNEMLEDFDKLVWPPFCIEVDPEQNPNEDIKPVILTDLTCVNAESNNNTTSSNAKAEESRNVVTNNWPSFYHLEIVAAKQNQNEMVQIVQNKDIPKIEKEEFASESESSDDNNNLNSNENYASSTSSSSSSSTSSNDGKMGAAVWQTYCVQNNIAIETEFMKNVENTQIAIGNKNKIDSAHPTLADLKHYATYPESSIYDPSQKLSDIHFKVICPSKRQTNPPRTWFTKEAIETLEIERRTTIQRDRNYRLNRRLIENQLVYRAAYLENINNTLKVKIDAMSTQRL